MEFDSSPSKQFSDQFVWFKYIMNKDLEWNLETKKAFRKQAVKIEQMFFKLMNSKTLKFRKRKKLWEKGQDWRKFHRIYGRKNDKTIRCFIKLLIYIERKVEEGHQDYDECDYSLAQDSDSHQEETNEDSDEEGGNSQQTESIADHDGYQSHGEECEDLMARVDFLREKVKSLVTYEYKPQQECVERYSYPDMFHNSKNENFIAEKALYENDEQKKHNDSYYNDEAQIANEETNGHTLKKVIYDPVALRDSKTVDWKVDLKENDDGSKKTSIAKVMDISKCLSKNEAPNKVKSMISCAYQYNPISHGGCFVSFPSQHFGGSYQVSKNDDNETEIKSEKSLSIEQDRKSIWIMKSKHSETKVESMISKNINIDQKDKSLDNLALHPTQVSVADGIVLNKSNITENYLLAGCSSKGDPSLQKEVTVNTEKLPQKMRKVNTETKMKNNENLDYGPTLDGGETLVLPPPRGCVDSVKNTSLALNLGEQVQDVVVTNKMISEKKEIGTHVEDGNHDDDIRGDVDAQDLFQDKHGEEPGIDVDTNDSKGQKDENLKVRTVLDFDCLEQKDMVDTNTVTHGENGKQNKSENDSSDALAVKEKENDSEEKITKGLYTTLLMRLHILSGNNLKRDNSATESNAYIGMVYVLHTDTSHEMLLDPASVLSEDYLLFDATEALAVRGTAQHMTWDPGVEPMLRRNMRKLDR